MKVRARQRRQARKTKRTTQKEQCKTMQATITFRFDPDQIPDLEAVRVRVGTVLMKGIGDHARLKRLTTEQWRLDTGRQASEAGNGADAAAPEVEPEEPKDDEVSAEDSLLWQAYDRWCELAVSTLSVKIVRRTKKSQEMDPEDPESWSWEESSMQALGWDKPKAILEMPVDLVGAWQNQVRAVNPGIFGPPLTGTTGNAKKKTHGVLGIA